MEGWQFGENELFECSCGNTLDICPFFRHIAECFSEAQIPFEFRNFGTSYRITDKEPVNRFLTDSLPLIRSSFLEKARDAIVWRFPPFAKKLKRADEANRIFIQCALNYSDASTFVDATKSPFRLRYLRRISGLEIHVVYLVRDPRGVTLSTMKTRGWDAQSAAKLWLGDQLNILRILKEFPTNLHVSYEDICESVDDTLASIHGFAGLPAQKFCGDFGASEHHILGNTMRLSGETKIRKNEKWRNELSRADLSIINGIVSQFVDAHPEHPLATIIEGYLGTDA